MGFIRRQQEKVALQLLQWHYGKTGQPIPDRGDLEAHARNLVADAHRIARERGGNILAILKEAVSREKPG